MLKIEIVLPDNYVIPISEALKKENVGGLTVYKPKGRGKDPGPEIHASKGTEIFVPQFSTKYCVELIIPDEKKNKIIKIIRDNAPQGKIFVLPVVHAIDIATGKEGTEVI